MVSVFGARLEISLAFFKHDLKPKTCTSPENEYVSKLGMG
jgi:hypothetical protein